MPIKAWACHTMRAAGRAGVDTTRLALLLSVVGTSFAAAAPALATQDGDAKPIEKQPEKQPEESGDERPAQPVTPAPKAANPPPRPFNPGATQGNIGQPAVKAGEVPAASTPATAQALPTPPHDPDHYLFNWNSEVNLAELVKTLQRDLGLQIIMTDAGLQNMSIVLTAPIKVRNDQVLPFLTTLLESKGYTLTKNRFDIYTVLPTGQGLVGDGVGGNDPFFSTQVIPTKGIKPSSINNYIPALGAGGTTGVTSTIVPLDEYGVIIVTDTPGRTQLIRDFIDQLVSLRDTVKIHVLDVSFVSATTARERVLALTGEGSGTAASNPFGVPQPGGAQPKQPNQGVPNTGLGGAGGGTSNLAAQLTVSPFSNSLFFKGRPEELPFVEDLLSLVDVKNRMISTYYPIGMRAAEIISAMGQREGLGEVTVQEASEDASTSPFAGGANRGLGQNAQGNFQPANQQSQQQGGLTGAGFVIFPDPGGFLYYGTAQQHLRVSELIETNKMLSVGEQIVYKFYKLKNTKAIDVADIVTALVSNQQPAGNAGGIIGRDLGRQSGSGRDSRSRSSRNNPGQRQQTQQQSPTTPGSNAVGGLDTGDETFVMADEKQNQIIVKTRAILQPEFGKLIEKLDARRPQVYIEAQIVAVSGSEDFRLAFEQQWFAGQFGINTNFGLGTVPAGNFLGRKGVATTLPGLTAAIVQSDKVPLIITALQTNSEGRVLATPQLLVDDNEPATVTSDTIVQTQVTTTIDAQPQVSVGEPVSAGTELTVTPQISENAVKLEVYVRQSAFIGAGSDNLPPDQQENIIDTGSVTVPRDSTIVIGGLSTENIGKTVIKVPLLGDIPLIGHLFRDQTTRKENTTLYVFITPRIMRDPNFADIRLLSLGPASEARIHSEFILPEPELMLAPIDRPRLPDEALPLAPTGSPVDQPPAPIEAEIPETPEKPRN